MTKLLLGARSTLFYAGYILVLVPHATLCILLGWMMPLRFRFRYIVWWNGFAVWWLGVTCNVRYRISGREHVPAGPCVLLSNHQSPWETLFLYHFFQPVCAILKQELLNVPFFGWALRLLKPIPIDRNKRTAARQAVLTEGKKRLQEGLSVLIFPEGTRVEPGEERRYSTSGADLAIAAGVKILPVAHNAGTCWPAHRLLKLPGTIDVVIGEPIDPTGREVRELTEAVQEWIRGAIRQ